ncbi:EKC/KEOPS complex subunit TP53RK [Parasteatoda tepidariorum]|uniref:EKC/KEOPS complex subunit TP53RK n=1 Tax=Parasteatoda tepidariorum TaxID=114398 RepID=UPI00077FC656|nr:EKC/KEOPS complex subunit TP53RK-like [Parasteatoda tepidariorum]
MAKPLLTYNFSKDLTLKENFTVQNQGSEAKIYIGTFLEKPSILKERFSKKYRHPDLDKLLTSERIRAEVRALNKCHEIGIKCPAIYFADLQARSIILQEITGSITVKEYLKSVQTEHGIDGINTLTPLAQKIGEGISKMHKNELVHGDLTTSNLLLKKDHLDDISGGSFDVYFIDFGLSKRDVMIEDKAVDLYVLERAISSSHPNSEKFYSAILQQYLKTLGKQSSAVADKLEEVRQRGRKRSMVG